MMRPTGFSGCATAFTLLGLLASASTSAQRLHLHAEGTVDTLLAIQYQHFQIGDPVSLDIVFDGSRTTTGGTGNERQFAEAVNSIDLRIADYTVSGVGTLSLFHDGSLPFGTTPWPVLDLFSIRSSPAAGLTGAAVDGLPLDTLELDVGFIALDPAWFTSTTLTLGEIPFGSQQALRFFVGFAGPYDHRLAGLTHFDVFTVRPVPLPAALWLLGSSVAGLAGWRPRVQAAC